MVEVEVSPTRDEHGGHVGVILVGLGVPEGGPTHRHHRLVRAGTVASNGYDVCIHLVDVHLQRERPGSGGDDDDEDPSMTSSDWDMFWTCMKPWAASSLCSLFRASFPAMIPVWGPTSPWESGAAVGFHFG